MKMFSVVAQVGDPWDWTWDEVDSVALWRAIIILQNKEARIFDGDRELTIEDLLRMQDDERFAMHEVWRRTHDFVVASGQNDDEVIEFLVEELWPMFSCKYIASKERGYEFVTLQRWPSGHDELPLVEDDSDVELPF